VESVRYDATLTSGCQTTKDCCSRRTMAFSEICHLKAPLKALGEFYVARLRWERPARRKLDRPVKIQLAKNTTQSGRRINDPLGPKQTSPSPPSGPPPSTLSLFAHWHLSASHYWSARFNTPRSSAANRPSYLALGESGDNVEISLLIRQSVRGELPAG